MDWKPQKVQAIALARIEDEILYGGARGGGKTDAGQAWLLYDIDKSYYRALVIRRNATDLEDWIDRARTMYTKCGAKYTGNTFTFPSGAKIRTGHLKDDNAFSKYQGHEYQKMLIEELTQISDETDYEKLRASNRSKYKDIAPQIFCTTNPDGAGHKWVKRRWNIPDQPTETVVSKSENGLTRVFIPSTVEDNLELLNNDPNYLRNLESIQDEELRRAWRYGSWEGFGVQGAYYRTQIQKAIEEKRIGNVPVNVGSPVITWWDLGVGDSTSIGFFQKAGREWHIIDYYEASGEGLAHYAAVLQNKGYIYEEHYAPFDIQVKELGTGLSRLEQAAAYGIRFRIAPKLSIDDGINALRTRFNTLWIDETRCARLIECLKNYQKEWNEKMGEFKPQPLHDWSSHAADMMRYWAVTDYNPQDDMLWKVSRNRMANKSMQ
jgi:hypothetical protein